MIELILCELLVLDGMLLGAALSVRLSGYQPQYFPRLHYFARMLDSDIFTISDYLQYVRRHAYHKPDGSVCNNVSYQAHTIIKTAEGQRDLGIPVKRRYGQSLRDAAIDYSTPWHQKHLNIIEQSYKKSPNFPHLYPEIAELLSRRHGSLAHLTCATIVWGLGKLLEKPLQPSRDQLNELGGHLPHEPFRLKRVILLSEANIVPPDKQAGRDANAWLIEQCRAFGADEYYFGGTSGAAYMDFSRFKDAGIALVEQEWRCTPYPQRGREFIPNLSILDLLMNMPPHEARAILKTRSPHA